MISLFSSYAIFIVIYHFYVSRKQKNGQIDSLTNSKQTICLLSHFTLVRVLQTKSIGNERQTHTELGISMGSRQPIRRQKPNALKLSGFVENFSLIILVINLLRFARFFIEIYAKYHQWILHFFAFFFAKNRSLFSRQMSDNSISLDQI